MLVSDIRGLLAKMAVELTAGQAQYCMALDEQRVPINPLVGKIISLTFTGEIRCQACGRLTKKSYSTGFCFPCMQRLARCDVCIVKPELCHYAKGTCREPDWADTFCMQSHIVYLANSSDVKVGITRESQLLTRWIDQGAIQALPVFRVKSRYQSGLVEVALRAHVSDRTDWRKMLKGTTRAMDLLARRDELTVQCKQAIKHLQQRFNNTDIVPILTEKVVDIDYPVKRYPQKIAALNFDKTAHIEGLLTGIKGQYLILDTGVLNIRKFSGYHITMSY